MTATVQDFVVEAPGVSGTATLTATNEFKVSGFSLKPPAPANPPVPALKLELLQSQIKQAAIAGRIKVADFPEIYAEVSFDLEGNLAFRIKADQALQIGSVGVRINDLRGRLEGGMLALSGNMGLDASKFPGAAIPQGNAACLSGDATSPRDAPPIAHPPSVDRLCFHHPRRCRHLDRLRDRHRSLRVRASRARVRALA